MPFELNADQFKKDGFLVVRSVFSPEEIGCFRERISAAAERAARSRQVDTIPAYPKLAMLQGDVLVHPELEDVSYIVLDPRIVEITRALLGGEVHYHGDSTVQIGEGPRGFHKDSADRNNPQGIDWVGQYGILRLGVYLQDHTAASGGLKVRVGSHRFVSHHRGKSINVPSGVGDVVLWYLTTSHSGNFVRLRGGPGVSLHPRLETLLPLPFRVPEPTTRMAVFCTFAASGVHFEHYLDYQAARDDVRLHWRRCNGSREAVERVQRAGIKFRIPSQDYGADAGDSAGARVG